jgi:hypothetical protein
VVNRPYRQAHRPPSLGWRLATGLARLSAVVGMVAVLWLYAVVLLVGFSGSVPA